MAERTADVQAHWTRSGVLARIDAALAELGQDPQILTPEILATVEHLHSGGLDTSPPRETASNLADFHQREGKAHGFAGKDGKSGLLYAQIGRFQGRPASRGACAPVPRRYV